MRFKKLPFVLIAWSMASVLCTQPSPTGVTLPIVTGPPLEMVAIQRAYPDKVDAVEFRNNDWALKISGQWFYWTEARLLPELALREKARWQPYEFYRYDRQLKDPPILTDAELVALNQRLDYMANGGSRHPGFQNALWRLSLERDSDLRIKSMYFLGRKVNVHRDIMEDLARVEERLQPLLKTDPEFILYMKNLKSIAGYNWRKIASTSNRSLHSYGIALDLTPKSYGGKWVYWQWEVGTTGPWYQVKIANRYMPPKRLIEAFEAEGFVWGGRWYFFDTMHFEYRPEILINENLR